MHALLLLLAGCPSGYAPIDDDTTPIFGSDDDATADDDSQGDDDTVATDDDTVTGSWPAEEGAFALVPGTTWSFRETILSGPESIEDDVLLSVSGPFAASDFPGPWAADALAYEVLVDRALGTDQRHVYGIDGTGRLFWVASETTNGLDVYTYEGDGSVVLREGNHDELLGQSWDAVYCLADIEGNDFRAEASNVVEHTSPGGNTIEVLEISVYQNEQYRGLVLWEEGYGLHRLDVELGAGSILWEDVASIR